MSPAGTYRKRLAQASLFRIGAPARKFGQESTVFIVASLLKNMSLTTLARGSS